MFQPQQIRTPQHQVHSHYNNFTRKKLERASEPHSLSMTSLRNSSMTSCTDDRSLVRPPRRCSALATAPNSRACRARAISSSLQVRMWALNCQTVKLTHFTNMVNLQLSLVTVGSNDHDSQRREVGLLPTQQAVLSSDVLKVTLSCQSNGSGTLALVPVATTRAARIKVAGSRFLICHRDVKYLIQRDALGSKRVCLHIDQKNKLPANKPLLSQAA
jgi:hypothetical protein